MWVSILNLPHWGRKWSLINRMKRQRKIFKTNFSIDNKMHSRYKNVLGNILHLFHRRFHIYKSSYNTNLSYFIKLNCFWNENHNKTTLADDKFCWCEAKSKMSAPTGEIFVPSFTFLEIYSGDILNNQMQICPQSRKALTRVDFTLSQSRKTLYDWRRVWSNLGW